MEDQLDIVNTEMASLAINTGRALTREASFLDDPWNNDNPALRQLGGAAKRGPKGNLQGGLRPCQYGIAIPANKAPPLATIKLESILPKKKRRTGISEKIEKQLSVLPAIGSKEDGEQKIKTKKNQDSGQKKGNEDQQGVGELSKIKSRGSRDFPTQKDLPTKARIVKPKGAVGKNGSKSAKSKSDGAKSDGVKLNGKKNVSVKSPKQKGSLVRRLPPKPTKSAENEGPKLKNSGMSWAISFDDPEPEQDLQTKPLSALKQEDAKTLPKSPQTPPKSPISPSKSTQINCYSKKVEKLKHKRPNSSGGPFLGDLGAKQLGKDNHTRPLSAGLSAGLIKGKTIAPILNKNLHDSRPPSLVTQKNPKRPNSGGIDKETKIEPAQFKSLVKPNKLSRPSSSGLDKKSRIELGLTLPKDVSNSIHLTSANKISSKGGQRPSSSGMDQSNHKNFELSFGQEGLSSSTFQQGDAKERHTYGKMLIEDKSSKMDEQNHKEPISLLGEKQNKDIIKPTSSFAMENKEANPEQDSAYQGSITSKSCMSSSHMMAPVEKPSSFEHITKVRTDKIYTDDITASDSGEQSASYMSDERDLGKEILGESEDESEEIMQELSEGMRKLLSGKLDDLPPYPKTSVRIFLSSTFSDMKWERNILSQKSFPELTEYCRQFNLEFHTVDMRWGVTDEAGNDHKTSILCLEEIKRCQSLGLGPTFVNFLGNRYGYRPFPSEINEEEFDILLSAIQENNLDADGLINKWFKKDDNNIPPLYVLQTISDIIPHYGDPSDATKRKAAGKKWGDTDKKLTNMLRQAASAAYDAGKITKERMHVYYKSVTEDEIHSGILTVTDAHSQCLSYIREMKGLTENINDKVAWQWIDVIEENGSNHLDNDAINLLDDLKINLLPQTLVSENRHTFDVEWYGNGIEPEKHPNHEEYVNEFAEKFTLDIKHLISAAAERWEYGKKQNGLDVHHKLATEVQHHSFMCNERCSKFVGREKEIEEIKMFITDTKKNHLPLHIFAEAGFGKTSIIAKVAHLLPVWFKVKDSVSVTRFIGTSPASTTANTMLKSVCNQISLCYGEDSPVEEHQTDYEVFQAFKFLIHTLGENGKTKLRPLFMTFDSIELLFINKKGLNITWMVGELPENIYLVTSALPQNDMHMKVKKSFKHVNECNIMHISGFSKETGTSIIANSLELRQRKVTQEQENLILDIFCHNSSPLLLKLMLDEAVLWESYKDASSLRLGKTIEKAIEMLFERIEDEYGKTLVSYSLAYITISKGGLSETELEDALSCNDKVLDDVYQYHNPPVDGVVRIPSLLWSRIRNQLGDYLVERNSDNTRVLAWYHTQFVGAASHRYIDCQGKDFSCKIHADLTEIFNAEQSIRRTITLHQRGITVDNADRQTKPQPLRADNTRKLSVLPYHMSKCMAEDEEQQLLKDNIYCNFKWLHTKLQTFGVREVVQDFKLLDDPDQEICLIRQTLCMATPSLSQSPQNLPIEILCRLPSLAVDFRGIARLVADAEDVVSQLTQPAIVPLFECLPSPGHLLQLSVTGVNNIHSINTERQIALINTHHHQHIAVWDIAQNESIHTIRNVEDHVLELTGNGKKLVGSDGKKIFIYHVDSGAKIKTFEPFPDDAGRGSAGKVINLLKTTYDGHTVFCVRKSEGKIYKIDTRNQTVIQSFDGRNVEMERECSKSGTEGQLNTYETRCTKSIPGHLTEITEIAVTKDNKILVTADDVSVCFWDAKSTVLKNTLYFAHNGCHGIEMSPGGKLCCAINGDKLIFFDFREASVILSIDVNSGDLDTRLSCPKFSSDDRFLVCGAGTEKIIFYSLDSGQPIKTISNNTKFGIANLEMDCTNQFLVSDGLAGHIRIWHIPSGDLVLDFKVFNNLTQGRLVQSNGKYFLWAINTTDNTMKIYHLTDIFMEARQKYIECYTDESIRQYEKEQIHIWQGKRDKSYAQIDTNDRPFKSGIDLMNAMDKDASKSKQLVKSKSEQKAASYSRLENDFRFPEMDLRATCVKLRPDGKFVLTTNEKGTIEFWRMENGSFVQGLDVEGCLNVIFDQSGKRIIGLVQKTKDLIPSLKLWEWDSFNEIILGGFPPDQQLPVEAMVLSSKGNLVFGVYSAMMGGVSLYVVDLVTTSLKHVLYLDGMIEGSLGKIMFTRLSQDENFLIIGNRPKNGSGTTFISYNLRGVLSQINAFKEEEKKDKLLNASGSPEGKKYAAALGHCDVELIGGKAVVNVKPNWIEMAADVYHPTSVVLKNNEMVTGTNTGELIVWDMEDCKVKRMFNRTKKSKHFIKPIARCLYKGTLKRGSVHKLAILCVCLSRDERYLAASSADHSVSVWDLDCESLLLLLHGHRNKVNSVAISHDNKYLVTGSADQTIRLWDRSCGAQLCVFHAQANIFEVQINPDNSSVIARGNKGVTDSVFFLRLINTQCGL